MSSSILSSTELKTTTINRLIEAFQSFPRGTKLSKTELGQVIDCNGDQEKRELYTRTYISLWHIEYRKNQGKMSTFSCLNENDCKLSAPHRVCCNSTTAKRNKVYWLHPALYDNIKSSIAVPSRYQSSPSTPPHSPDSPSKRLHVESLDRTSKKPKRSAIPAPIEKIITISDLDSLNTTSTLTLDDAVDAFSSYSFDITDPMFAPIDTGLQVGDFDFSKFFSE